MANDTIVPIAPTGEELKAFAETIRLMLAAFEREFAITGEHPFYYYEILYALYKINSLGSMPFVAHIQKFGAKEIDTLKKVYSKPDTEEVQHFQEYNRVAGKIHLFMQSVRANLLAKNIIK